MAERFTIADLHFSHRNIVSFARDDGTALRPWGRVLADGEVMSDAERDERVRMMDDHMVENWNSVVGPKDKVEVLGDVVINRRALPILNRLNGDKRLRYGNHDIFTRKFSADYAPYFSEASAYRVFDDMILSHIPIHRDSVKQRWLGNVHGHLHDGRVMHQRHSGRSRRVGFAPSPGQWRLGRLHPVMETVIDPLYFCVSVEHIHYTPIALDVVRERMKEERELWL